MVKKYEIVFCLPVPSHSAEKGHQSFSHVGLAKIHGKPSDLVALPTTVKLLRCFSKGEFCRNSAQILEHER